MSASDYRPISSYLFTENVLFIFLISVYLFISLNAKVNRDFVPTSSFEMAPNQITQTSISTELEISSLSSTACDPHNTSKHFLYYQILLQVSETCTWLFSCQGYVRYGREEIHVYISLSLYRDR